MHAHARGNTSKVDTHGRENYEDKKKPQSQLVVHGPITWLVAEVKGYSRATRVEVSGGSRQCGRTQTHTRTVNSHLA